MCISPYKAAPTLTPQNNEQMEVLGASAGIQLLSGHFSGHKTCAPTEVLPSGAFTLIGLAGGVGALVLQRQIHILYWTSSASCVV